ncbi:hypothetical protein KSP40_PGU014668 [Platanthera guangdongensis]|uniref:Uncharacterized protein n=1 Tax=Platanthera guangdongensis TaxID=2320717 RepID=A0ABR2MZ76_9ASPA
MTGPPWGARLVVQPVGPDGVISEKATTDAKTRSSKEEISEETAKPAIAQVLWNLACRQYRIPPALKANEEAKAEALLKVEEAENAWRKSVEVAVPLRCRAQLLMENADLAAYKSVMALKIAEAIGSMSSEVDPSGLDWLPEELLLN